jgi:hypothetical protein
VLAVAFMAGIAQLGPVSAASAATKCAVNHANDNWQQFCEYHASYSGASFVGTSSWNYADSKEAPFVGQISGKVTDIAGDGACAIGQVGWEKNANGPITWVVVTKACGKGTTVPLGGNGTTGEITLSGNPSGIYVFQLCSPSKNCETLFYQDIKLKHPS